ncbi:MAG: molybdopterin biosynthesis protein [Anaerolineae bacterium]|nr:molybdopterin biosynthesis protein [Anaerolineae bacterium]
MTTDDRNIYLHDIPLDEAWARFTDALAAADLWRPLDGESVPVDAALGRVTADPVWANVSSPHYHAAAMDGYAVRARDTVGATETTPLTLLVGTPETVERPAQAVNTGNALPAWADAVIMIEHVQPIDNDEANGLLIRSAVAPWQHVRPLGEDMVATELILPANHRLRPVDLGAVAGSGHVTVSVRRKPRVAILATGDELVRPGEALHPGDVIEYNGLVLAAQVTEWGGDPVRLPPAPDDFAAIRAAVAEAARAADLVLVNAGSSAGSKDHTAAVVEALGELLVHGVAVRPGHPVVLGMAHVAAQNDDSHSANQSRVMRSIPVIGVPGYPVSAALTGEIFVQPLLAQWLGRPADPAPTVEGELTRKVLSPTGDEEFLRVTVGQVGERVLVTPLGRGAGVITSLVRADGLVRIPRFSEGHDAGDRVTVHLYRAPGEIAHSALVIGSHDLTLDLLAQFLALRHPGFRLVSAHVGSLGGLMALRRGQAHLAGCHLLDVATGEYNVSYVRQYVPGQTVRLITLVGRVQGLILPPGNPKGIAGIPDLARADVTTVNRQRGAGTRLLLDHLLGEAGIMPEQVQGYEHEQITHMAVAAAVQSGQADCGMGVLAAARALELDFIPLATERYDLALPLQHEDVPAVRATLDLLHEAAFRAAVAALPGYDVRAMGDIAAEVGP